MIRISLFLLFICSSIQAGVIKKYYTFAEIDDVSKKIQLYLALNQEELYLTKKKEWKMDGNSLTQHIATSKKTIPEYVCAAYDIYGDIIRLDSFKDGNKVTSLSLQYTNSVLFKSFDTIHGLNDTFEYNSMGKIKKISTKNRYNDLLYVTIYLYNGPETKLIKYFPVGEIGKVSLYKEDTRGNVHCRVKTYQKGNVRLRIVDKSNENNQLPVKYSSENNILDTRRFLSILSLTYDQFEEYDHESITKIVSPSKKVVRSLYKDGIPEIYFMTDNIINLKYTLLKKNMVTQNNSTYYADYFYNNSVYDGFVKTCYDSEDKEFVKEYIYDKGLLKSLNYKSLNYKNGNKPFYSRKYVYYVNREVMKELIYIKEKLHNITVLHPSAKVISDTQKELQYFLPKSEI